MRSRCSPSTRSRRCCAGRSAGLGAGFGRRPGQEGRGRHVQQLPPDRRTHRLRLHAPRAGTRLLRMMANHGVPASRRPGSRRRGRYLVKTYPVKGRARRRAGRRARKGLDEGLARRRTPGSRPHDPLAARDGSLWYTGQMANALGPRRSEDRQGQGVSAQDRRTPARTAWSEDKDGNIWYTGNTGALIGKLDPKTGAVTEYPMPDPKAKDPHTLLFDQAGILWFTVQNANRIGRLDPKTGEIKLLTPPTPKSRPYGMAFDSKGNLFVVAVRRQQGRAASIRRRWRSANTPCPIPAARPRRIADHDATTSIWYADYSRGYLGRLDPATGKVTEWPSPSGPKSAPYGISAIKDVIWYSESEAEAEHRRALRSEDREVPELGDPRRRQHRAQYRRDRNGNFVLANSLVMQSWSACPVS